MKPLVFVSIIIAMVLSACAAHRSTADLYMERAEAAIGEQNWEVAYRFLEDQFISKNPENRQKALATVRQHPEIIEAGARTFSSRNISKTVTSLSQSRGIDWERQRLKMFKVVATPAAYEMAKSNIDGLATAVDVARKEEERLTAEQNRRNEQARVEEQRRLKQLRIDLIEATKNARVSCQTKIECDKAFSLTEIFISENSDMKIQVATNTIVETFNPNELAKIGLKAIKIPQKNETAEIILTVSCRDDEKNSFKDVCNRKMLSIYTAYPLFIQSTFRK